MPWYSRRRRATPYSLRSLRRADAASAPSNPFSGLPTALPLTVRAAKMTTLHSAITRAINLVALRRITAYPKHLNANWPRARRAHA
eukprot:scaffold245521_cov28-Tisochrysis_lutea.AAC.1